MVQTCAIAWQRRELHYKKVCFHKREVINLCRSETIVSHIGYNGETYDVYSVYWLENCSLLVEKLI